MALRDQVLDDMPIEYRDRFSSLLDRTSATLGTLGDELDEYMDSVQRLAALTQLDVSTLERLGDVLRELLRSHDRLDPERQALVQAALRYFVTEDDDEEVTGVLAFDDDIQVINAVSRALGRHDLLIPFRPPPLDG